MQLCKACNSPSFGGTNTNGALLLDGTRRFSFFERTISILINYRFNFMRWCLLVQER